MRRTLELGTIGILVVLLSLSAAAQGVDKLAIDVTFNKDNITPQVNSIEKSDTKQLTPLNQNYGNYELILRDEDGDPVGGGSMNIVFKLSRPSAGDINQINRTIYLNFLGDATQMVWEHKGKEVSSIDIPERICEGNESCTDYCKKHGAAATHCEISEEDGLELNPLNTLIAIAIVATGIFILLYRYRREEFKEKASKLGF